MLNQEWVVPFITKAPYNIHLAIEGWSCDQGEIRKYTLLQYSEFKWTYMYSSMNFDLRTATHIEHFFYQD